MKNVKPCRKQQRNPEFDPIEWAIIAIIISGSSLLLALETKVQNRKKAKNDEVARRAKNANKERLQSIQGILLEMDTIVKHIQKTGKLIVNESKSPLGRFSLDFETKENFDHFNDDFDRLMELIAKLNRSCNAIDVQGIDLTPKDMEEFVDIPLKSIKALTQEAINVDIDPKTRMLMVEKLLKDYSVFVNKLSAILT